MKTIREALEALPSSRQRDAALKEVRAAEKAQKTLRGMFDDDRLDPYPTSDASEEHVLRRWCGWKSKEEA